MSALALICGLGAALTLVLLREGQMIRRSAIVARHRRGPLRPRPLRRRDVAELSAIPLERRLAMAVPAGLVLAVVGGGVVPAAIVSGAVVVLPVLAGRLAAWRRDQAVEAAMPQLLDEMARGMRAGLSASVAFVEATRLVPGVNEATTPGVVDRLRSGDDLVRACAAWAEHRPSPSTELLATAVAVGAVVGGVHARTIDAVAATLRERQGVDAELATQALQARLSALVMTVAPIVFCAFLVLSDPRASRFLLRTPVGIACAAVGISLDGVAALWMARIARGARG